MKKQEVLALRPDEYSRHLTPEGFISYAKTLGVPITLRELEFFKAQGLLKPITQAVTANPLPIKQKKIHGLSNDYYVAEHIFLLCFLQKWWKITIKNEMLDPQKKVDTSAIAEKIQEHRKVIAERSISGINNLVSAINAFYVVRGHYNVMIKGKKSNYQELLRTSPTSVTHLDFFSSTKKWTTEILPEIVGSELRRSKLSVAAYRKMAQLFGEEGFSCDPMLSLFLDIHRGTLLSEKQAKELEGPSLLAMRYYEVSHTLFWFVQHAPPSRELFCSLEDLYRNNHYRSDQRCTQCGLPLPLSSTRGRPRENCAGECSSKSKKALVYSNRIRKTV